MSLSQKANSTDSFLQKSLLAAPLEQEPKIILAQGEPSVTWGSFTCKLYNS